ncbi:hypothetical protein [Bacteroides sp. f07]|uniref:hypothetical protein n=1 Tax=Bacteroides sp. f07 TaxID=3132704 RepID=UPI0036F2905F
MSFDTSIATVMVTNGTLMEVTGVTTGTARITVKASNRTDCHCYCPQSGRRQWLDVIS